MFFKMIFLIFAALAFCACAPGDEVTSSGAVGINVWHDVPHSVTCWIYHDSVDRSGGISCLPDSEVKNVR